LSDSMAERPGRSREHDHGAVDAAIHRPHDSHAPGTTDDATRSWLRRTDRSANP